MATTIQTYHTIVNLKIETNHASPDQRLREIMLKKTPKKMGKMEIQESLNLLCSVSGVTLARVLRVRTRVKERKNALQCTVP